MDWTGLLRRNRSAIRRLSMRSGARRRRRRWSPRRPGRHPGARRARADVDVHDLLGSHTRRARARTRVRRRRCHVRAAPPSSVPSVSRTPTGGSASRAQADSSTPTAARRLDDLGRPACRGPGSTSSSRPSRTGRRAIRRPRSCASSGGHASSTQRPVGGHETCAFCTSSDRAISTIVRTVALARCSSQTCSPARPASARPCRPAAESRTSRYSPGRRARRRTRTASTAARTAPPCHAQSERSPSTVEEGFAAGDASKPVSGPAGVGHRLASYPVPDDETGRRADGRECWRARQDSNLRPED